MAPVPCAKHWPKSRARSETDSYSSAAQMKATISHPNCSDNAVQRLPVTATAYLQTGPFYKRFFCLSCLIVFYAALCFVCFTYFTCWSYVICLCICYSNQQEEIQLLIYPFIYSTYLPIYQSTCLPISLSVCLPIYLSFCLPIYLSIYLPTHLSIYVYPPTFLSSLYLPTYLPTLWHIYLLSLYLSTSLSICLPTYPLTYPPTLLPTYLSIYPPTLLPTNLSNLLNTWPTHLPILPAYPPA